LEITNLYISFTLWIRCFHKKLSAEGKCKFRFNIGGTHLYVISLNISTMADLFYTDHEAFIKRLTDIVFANLHNENFGVEDLAREAGLSRSTLHRRLSDIKQQHASQFIREIRLKRAMELLQHHAGRASTCPTNCLGMTISQTSNATSAAMKTHLPREASVADSNTVGSR